MATRLAVHTIRVMGPDHPEDDSVREWDEQNRAVLDQLNTELNEVEAQLSTNLPEGFYVKIEG